MFPTTVYLIRRALLATPRDVNLLVIDLDSFVILAVGSLRFQASLVIRAKGHYVLG